MPWGVTEWWNDFLRVRFVGLLSRSRGAPGGKV
jgi:hypothetical protein